MRILKRKVVSLLLVVLVTFTSTASYAQNDAEKNIEEVITSMAKAVSDKDVESYISFFSEENRNEMREASTFLKSNEFFREDNMKVVNINEISKEYQNIFISLSENEMKYDETKLYYVEFDLEVATQEKYLLNGSNFRLVLIVKEENEWKIARISVPSMKDIIDNEAGFGNKAEDVALECQDLLDETGIVKDNDLEIISNLSTYEVGISTRSAYTHTEPSIITVYFTKSSNRLAFGAYRLREDVGFDSYVKDVLPNEWIASWYINNPQCVKAGAMAVKMYGWYHTVHPKWQYSPYYADVKDNTSDQEYLRDSNHSYTNSAVDAIDYIGLDTITGDLFETSFRAGVSGNPGTQSSGIMTAYGSLYWDQNGKYCEWILDYYYDYCYNLGNNGENVSYFFY